ncbi:hypothetical protein LguiA_012921 [Lonicera macranthoides]
MDCTLRIIVVSTRHLDDLMASSEHSYGIWCENCLLGELYLFSMIWRDIYALVAF